MQEPTPLRDTDDARRATVGGSGSFEAFHAAERDRLVRLLALTIGDVDLAAEAVDVALSRAWQQWGRLDEPAGWTYRVARNWTNSWFRRRRRISSAEVPEVAVTADHAVHHDHLRDALDQLSEDHRAVVVLRILGEYSTKETAAALDVPTGTVTSRLSRALDNLRDLVGDDA